MGLETAAGVAAEAADQAADELRLAGAEVAVEGDALAADEAGGNRRGDRLGLLDTVGEVLGGFGELHSMTVEGCR